MTMRSAASTTFQATALLAVYSPTSRLETATGTAMNSTMPSATPATTESTVRTDCGS